MTNLKTTKRALLSSVIALLVCFTMLLGTTFAWFTDSVTSNGNIIQTGTLEIGMYWAEGDEAVPTATEDWKDASQGAIFNNTKWEPGYVEAKHIKIANEGTLALKYKLLIVPNGEVEALADVIDVYYVAGATQVTRDTLPETALLVGTLRDMIEDTDGAVHGALLPVGETATDTYERVGEVTATIAFKMREEAGNEYKGMSIGTDFSIQLLATQYTFEEDSFDNQYDKDAGYPPVVVASASEMLDALANGDSVELANDLTITEDFIIQEGEVTIDLAGHKFSLEKESFTSSGQGVTGEGTVLNIVNSSDSPVELEFDAQNFLAVGLGATLNLENVNLKLSEELNDTIRSAGYNTFTCDGGTINFYSGTIEAVGTAVMLRDNSTFNMYGGEIVVEQQGRSGCNGIQVYGTNVTINLYGGKIINQCGAQNSNGIYILGENYQTQTAYINIEKDFSIENFSTDIAYLSDYASNHVIVDKRIDA